jgi:plasmid stability protein
MATLTVRDLDEALVRKLRIRAAEHGRSAEAEHREILRSVLEPQRPMPDRQEIIRQFREFRDRFKDRELVPGREAILEARRMRMRKLLGSDEGLE